ncbi:MAG: pantoate--beta-alanine ligase [Ekhidna sp.]|uniref:pantoate--beta-alanine ligase n=1 Tax=Ekhidna sp. TaxID=2608089 RepID=UPI0032F00742
MRIISALNELSQAVLKFKKDGQTIGFVPTMGALHEGHLALAKESQSHNNVTVVSIFVNPLQFNNSDDLAKYPRVIEEDIKLLETKNVDVVFIPSESDLYPSKPQVTIDFGELSKTLEGQYRSGHFEGVGIVVSKLLHLVQPDRAYFGMKDLQQYLLIKKMCQDLNFQCEIIGVETVRESSGLALSSRNRRLSEKGLKEAQIISQGLTKIKSGIEKGESLEGLVKEVKGLYQSSQGFKLEYLEAVNPLDLSPITTHVGLDELAVCVAGYVEGVRLIDNLYLRLK